MNSIKPNIVPQYRKEGCSDWYDGHPNHSDGGGPYETRTLFAAVPASERSDKSPAAPTMPEPAVEGETRMAAALRRITREYIRTRAQIDGKKSSDDFSEYEDIMCVQEARKALAAPVAQPLAPIGAVPDVVYKDANRFQLLKKAAFNRTVNGFDGKVLTWTLTIPADEHGDGTLEEATDQLAAYHDFKPAYVAAQPLAGQVAAPAVAPVPEGWKLVPIEPTNHMVDQICQEDLDSPRYAAAKSALRGAILAAPSQQPTDSAAQSGDEVVK